MKTIWLGMLALSLTAPGWSAEAKQGDSVKAEEKAPAKGAWKSFFKTLVKSLEQTSTSRYASKGVRVTAVAAVRGAGQESEDPLKPYWKGGWSAKAAEAYKKEAEEFRAAAQVLLDGKTEEAVSQLQAFKKAHPKSILLPDVEEALKQADAAKAETEEAAPSQPSGEKAAPAPGASGGEKAGKEEGEVKEGAKEQ